MFFHEAELENNPIFLASFIAKPCRKPEVDPAFIAESWNVSNWNQFKSSKKLGGLDFESYFRSEIK